MIKLQALHRPCGSCTKCCEGHLIGNAYGYAFGYGKSCRFVCKKGCSIYNYRPKNPCVGFVCGYKIDHSIDEDLRPDLSNVIFVYRTLENISYLHGTSTGLEPAPKLVQWAQQWARTKQKYILIPRNIHLRSIPVWKVSIYGPDDQSLQILCDAASNGGFTIVVD